LAHQMIAYPLLPLVAIGLAGPSRPRLAPARSPGARLRAEGPAPIPPPAEYPPLPRKRIGHACRQSQRIRARDAAASRSTRPAVVSRTGSDVSGGQHECVSGIKALWRIASMLYCAPDLIGAPPARRGMRPRSGPAHQGNPETRATERSSRSQVAGSSYPTRTRLQNAEGNRTNGREQRRGGARGLASTLMLLTRALTPSLTRHRRLQSRSAKCDNLDW
jgi:hypothetical protein